jgi:hypothetical protein
LILESSAELVERWVRHYTRNLPPSIAERRADEMSVDLHDHIHYERTRSTSDVRIALSILSRMVRGLLADVSWRRRVRQSKGDAVKKFVPILIAVMGVLIGVPAMLYGSADDSPGLVLLGLLFIAATLAFAVSPALRSKSRVLQIVLGAAAVWIGVVGVAGWLENMS